MSGSNLRKSIILVAVATLTMVIAGCGGGGGATSATGSVTPGAPAGPAVMEITLAAATATGSAAAPVTVAGPSTVPTPDPAYKWPSEIREPSQKIEHVFMEVVKVSLMPAAETFGSEDMDGEIQAGNPTDPPSTPDKPHFVTTVVDPPICIDLLKLENGKKLARLLNRFDQVQAGVYDKIRVYYRRVTVVVREDDGTLSTLVFHPTANSKFDIHFRRGHELVIPSASDTTQPDGWVKFFRVRIDVVGLKLNVVPGGNNKKEWKNCKVILRPQIFAEAGNEILYSVAGTASNVSSVATPPVSGAFYISFGTGSGSRTVDATFDNATTWTYSDNVLGDSVLVPSWTVNNVPNTTAVPAFRNGAKVMAIGPFNPSLVLQATDIVFTFPHVREGRSDNVWIPPDNVAFIVRGLLDNVTVFPQPDRSRAYFDNLIANPLGQHIRLDDTHLDNTLLVRARGYFNSYPNLDAYWISIGGIFPGP